MLNLKKGLALVLAAATAFTFAPVASLPALAADKVTTDGLTTGTGIDSKPANVTVAEATTASDGAASDSVWLQEHEGKSSNNTLTKAYRITIQKHKNNNGTYFDAVKLQASSTAGDNTDGNFSNVTATAASVKSTDSLQSFNKDYLDESVYYVEAAAQETANDGISKLGGAYVRFRAAQLSGTDYVAGENVSGTYTVTVEGLGAFSESAKTLDKSTFTVTIPNKGESLSIKKTSYVVAEDSKITVPYTIAFKANSDHFTVTTDNSSVAYLKTTDVGVYTGNETNPTATEAEYKITPLAATGTFTVYTGEAGVANIKVADHKSNHDEINSVTLQIKVTPKNGKLYVTYETNDGTYTFNDDAAFDTATSNANATQIKRLSIQETMSDKGVFDDVATNDVDQNGLIDGTNATTPATTDEYSFATKYNSGWWRGPSLGGAVLPAARTLYTDGKQTVQITGSSDAGAEVSYALVAPAYYYTTDSSNASTNKTAAGTTPITTLDKVPPSDASANKVAKINGSVQSLTQSSYGAGSTIEFTETAAREYGSIDKNGLVTLKDAKNAPELYVIVTAKKADAVDGVSAARATSTFIVPVDLKQQQPVSLYVSDSKFFAEATSGDYASSPIHNTLYLSLKDRKTDTLAHKANVSDNYITVTSSDDSVVDVNGWTLTAKKAGSATITVKTSSAPEVSGIASVKINVVVNNLNSSTNVVTAKGVSVNKEKPNAKVEASSNVNGSTVIFDRNALYKVDSTMPSGYSLIRNTEDHANDVLVSSTGNVTYQKNDGTVYVRAYASGTSEYNPATYVYIPVNYGQKVVTTDLNVDQTPITLDVKETKKITASVASGASITYTSQDPTVATVAADGTVTAVKSGTTYVTVKGVAADGTAAESAIVAVIVKGNATITDDTVKKPSKVTGVKVTNLKGGKVKVTWTKQNQKNIKYYVKKTVGKKSAGKSVGSNKTTLSVKKGATVKVKVKAYIYNAEGTKLVGSYSKTITKKTDKK